MLELDSKICGDAFVWRANLFICDELHLNGIAAVFAAFAEELQTTINNSVGIISYLTYMSRGFINIDGMGVSKWRPDVGEKTSFFMLVHSTHIIFVAPNCYALFQFNF